MWAYVESAEKHPRTLYSIGVITVALRKKNDEAIQSSLSGLGLLQKQQKPIVNSEMKGQKRKINYLSCVNRKTSHKKGNGDHMRMGVVKICLTGNLRPEKKIVARKI